MNIKKELTKGSSAMLVLAVLEEEDLYGYLIIKRISEKSEKVFNFKEGTLYPILHTFEQNGYVKSRWEVFEGRKRKYYSITSKGRRVLSDAKKEWESYSTAIYKTIGVKQSVAAM